ncbi:hypothetical protein FVR03_18245 [Pontibacter qinzhouensis]|uniref:DUF3575 domain-containing protein n=2 Tax=Pontibacter qinzhouensis TaxID=2603253 RepID=A0A5C8JB20_9BACT|nr:hypothetical protein FVR03_18245 [Pontibacter qinzhouensis]
MATAQDASVEKSIYGIQTGFLGIWAHNESRIADKFAIRSEIGFDAGLFGSGFSNNNLGYVLTPVLTVEPRWYYNIKRRDTKGRRTANNSANFLTAKINYHPDWFTISSDDRWVHNQIAVIPTWGIRRVIGKHFTYETAIGLGYRYTFRKSYGFSTNLGEAAFDLDLRIGYTF